MFGDEVDAEGWSNGGAKSQGRKSDVVIGSTNLLQITVRTPPSPEIHVAVSVADPGTPDTLVEIANVTFEDGVDGAASLKTVDISNAYSAGTRFVLRAWAAGALDVSGGITVMLSAPRS